MNHSKVNFRENRGSSLVAQFGDARLVRRVNGSLQLCGGSPDERAQAHDWIVRFLRQANARARIEEATIPRAA